ncbi:hypothetical protein DFR29_12344 [Tahibacter aquaticus]|uniref:Uncharacterized protein n=1 Tax=Tahibacter aquaticus TaxID=520092 RepID=A0A4R6YL26_9GAMM|nr:hypothetical protein [Tahibacter aquaticus]TDR37870.1 hypothetical protein DFR29_12344 [Tahibacter aquaticus]
MQNRLLSHAAEQRCYAWSRRAGYWSARVFQSALLLVLAGILAGCGHSIRGGPHSTLNQAALGTPSSLPAAGQELLAAASPEQRNALLDRRLMMIDQAYVTYINGLREEKTLTDLATGLAGLALGVAGTLTDGVAAKTNYAAAGTLLAGGSAIVDQTLYYEQTVLALVSAMDANRATVRLTIVRGMNQDMAEYTASDAYADLIAYERAGSLLAAIGYVQATAKEAQQLSEGQIRDIIPLPPGVRGSKACSTRSLFASNAKRTAANLLTAAAALKIDVPADEKTDADKIAERIRQLNRDATPEGVASINAALARAGVLVDCSP